MALLKTVTKDGQSGSEDSLPQPGSRVRPETTNVQLPLTETDIVLRLWGTCQKAFVDKFGGLGVDVSKLEIVRAAVRVFGQMNDTEVVKAVLEVYEEDSSAIKPSKRRGKQQASEAAPELKS